MITAKLRQLLRAKWQVLVAYFLLFGSLSMLQFAMLGSLLNGFSVHEVQAYDASSNLGTIWHEPLQAPFTLAAHAILYLLPGSLFALRLTAAMFGLVVIGIFCVFVRSLYGQRVAFLATALFGSSSWLLHTSRLGTPDVLFFGVFALAGAIYWLRHTQQATAWLACVILSVGLLYVPGMIWFLALGLLWQARPLRLFVRQRRWVGIVGTVVAIGGTAPLAWTLYRTPSLARAWAGLPEHWPSISVLARAIAAVPAHIFIRGSGGPEYSLGHLPMLGIFSSTMFVFGIYACVQGRSKRTLAGWGLALILAVLLIGLQGGVSLVLLAPFAMLLVAAGMKDVWDRWLRVFPRNPIARAFGFGLLGVVAAMACAYNIRAYFVAWPQSTTTEAAFTYRRP